VGAGGAGGLDPAIARWVDDGRDRAVIPGARADHGTAHHARQGEDRAAAIPYRAPTDADLPQRLSAVLAGVYLVHTEGHTASSGSDVRRPDLAAEAIRLGRLVHHLMPDEPEVTGLLALMVLSESRRSARTTPDGAIVVLKDQDRHRWDADLIT